MTSARVARFESMSDAVAQQAAVRLMKNLRSEGDCWVWSGAKTDGYGAIWVNKQTERAHVVAMYFRHGAKALGAETINHLCFNRACCNPDHMQFATRRENTLHGNGPTSSHASQTHCVNGHELSAENIYLSSLNERECRKCKRQRDSKYRKQRRDRRKEGT